MSLGLADPPGSPESEGHPAATTSLRTDDGACRPLATDRWFEPPSPPELRLLDRVVGPALDLGCGPGRLVAALRERGVAAIGVDSSPVAQAVCRAQHLPTIGRSVFGRLPREGHWGSALLLDGNVGIGGDPERLFDRVAALLAPGGRLLVELGPPTRDSVVTRARLETVSGPGEWFAWAEVGAHELRPLLGRRFGRRDVWSDDGRWFAEVVRR